MCITEIQIESRQVGRRTQAGALVAEQVEAGRTLTLIRAVRVETCRLRRAVVCQLTTALVHVYNTQHHATSSPVNCQLNSTPVLHTCFNLNAWHVCLSHRYLVFLPSHLTFRLHNWSASSALSVVSSQTQRTHRAHDVQRKQNAVCLRCVRCV